MIMNYYKIKNLILSCFFVLLSLNAFTQRRINVSLVNRFNNVSNFSTAENIPVISKDSSVTYFRYTYDYKKNNAYHLKKYNLSPKSNALKKLSTDTLLDSNYGALNFWIKNVNGKNFCIVYDNNFNGQCDDSTYVIKPNIFFPITTLIKYSDNNKIIKRKIKYNLKLQINEDYSIKSLELSHSNSSIGFFKIFNNKYFIEIRISKLSKWYDSNNVDINISEKNKELKKIDNINVFVYKAIYDTITLGNLKIVIDDISSDGKMAVIRWIHILDVSKEKGYKINAHIENFSLPNIYDTTNRKTLETIYKSSKYTLLDFWGSWCKPCIDNFKLLKKIRSEYSDAFLNVVGIDCEFTDEIQNSLQILQTEQIDWPNYFFNARIKTSLNNKLFIKIFPTYILLDSQGKILLRENSEGIKKIEEFIFQNYKITKP